MTCSRTVNCPKISRIAGILRETGSQLTGSTATLCLKRYLRCEGLSVKFRSDVSLRCRCLGDQVAKSFGGVFQQAIADR